MATFFICHSRMDEEYVRHLSTELESRGLTCWFYERDNDGEPIGSAVDDAMAESPALIFVMTENMQRASQYIQNELNEFIQDGKKIIPLRVQMSKNFWPHGSRGLIQSIPVVDDSEGELGFNIINEIIRRVGGMPANYDRRLEKCLDEAQIHYSIDKDGDFQTQWLFNHEGRKYDVWIELISKTFISPENQRELRRVSGYFRYKGNRKVLVGVLEQDEENWSIREEGEDHYFVSCAFVISANASDCEIRNGCEKVFVHLRRVVLAILRYNGEKNGGSGSGWGTVVAAVAGAIVGAGVAIASSSNENS